MSDQINDRLDAMQRHLMDQAVQDGVAIKRYWREIADGIIAYRKVFPGERVDCYLRIQTTHERAEYGETKPVMYVRVPLSEAQFIEIVGPRWARAHGLALS